jgi:hypothetical protein
MNHISEKTINTVINLADRCYPPHDQESRWIDPSDEKEIEEALKPRPEEEGLENFINALSDDEKAELMALMWLGRDGGQWEDLLNHAKNEIDDVAIYMAKKAPLATYLKKGLERAIVDNLI